MRRIVLSLLLLVQPSAPILCQTGNHKSDIDTYVDECRRIDMVLNARERHREPSDPIDPDDDFNVAQRGCAQLQSALASSNMAKVQSATAELRPIFARLGLPPTTPQEQLEAMEKSAAGASGMDLEYKLDDLAKRAYSAGDLSKASHYANQLLKMASDYPRDWNYGNAVFYGNFVLGRVALQQGNVSLASNYLLASASTPGSPQLDTFGPNMSLAKELLEKGQKDVVLQYLEKCKKFWSDDFGKADKWISEVRSGHVPDFGANLNY